MTVNVAGNPLCHVTVAKYLGLYILTWQPHIDHVVSGARARLYRIRRLQFLATIRKALANSGGIIYASITSTAANYKIPEMVYFKSLNGNKHAMVVIYVCAHVCVLCVVFVCVCKLGRDVWYNHVR